MAAQSNVKKSLSPANIQLLLKDVYKQPKLKAQIIHEISSFGLAVFVYNRFRVNAHQKEELDNIKDRDVENVFNKAIIATLNRNGNIELVNEGHNPANMSVDFYAKKTDDGYEVGVTVTC